LLTKSACANFFLSGVPSAAVIGSDAVELLAAMVKPNF
jgi:hypothetical protein